MRLGLFDRIRRLVRPRRSKATGTAPQGRHRRDQRHTSGYGPAAGPGEPSPPDAAPGSPSRPAALPPDDWPAPDAAFAREAQLAPARRAAGSPAVRVGGGRARIREAPGEPDARAVPGLPPDRHQAPPPAVAADPRAGAPPRPAAGIPHQAGEAGRPSRLAGRADLR